MTFRTRLIVLIALTVVVTVGLATWAVSAATRHAFERLDDERTQALVAQFRREFVRRGREVVQTVERIAAAESTLRMALDLRRRKPDYALYVNEAGALASAHALDFVELVVDDGTLISSAQWPARFGYKNEWVVEPVDWNAQDAFLKREELQDEVALALVAVRAVSAGKKKLYIVAGYRLDREFLASLALPPGMRTLLYRNFEAGFSSEALIDASGTAPEAQKLAPLIGQVRAQGHEVTQTIRWSSGPETFQAIPLAGREDSLLGVLLVGRSRRELVALVNRIRSTGVLVGGIGVVLGIVLSYWVSARVTQPVERLVQGAREVASGNWDARVDVQSGDEIGELAVAFNHMTEQLLDQRDRLVQTERVAAWRELARRLAHELKNPLFPLQITIENLQRARGQAREQFEEVFRESTATLLAELETLKTIIGRFSDFAKMPPPQIESVDLNEVIREALKLFEAQFHAQGGPSIARETSFDENLGKVQADPEQLTRAFQNLMLNAIDAMAAGGTLTIRTRRHNTSVQLEVSDTGAGLTKEECDRLFTPYYTTKQHGTGLGLAIVQSVVSDHNGRISVESEPGRGTTFRIELPISQSPNHKITT
jgi:signal transduction histidine kinase